VKRRTPTPYPAPGSDGHTGSNPGSANHAQISGKRSGAERCRVQATVRPYG
jgi:hypothetical protein